MQHALEKAHFIRTISYGIELTEYMMDTSYGHILRTHLREYIVIGKCRGKTPVQQPKHRGYIDFKIDIREERY
jgi:hypothetical protein